ncbi:MAG TPA: TetR/AcrR family transcriptional regulator [Propionicimonas sp.]|nr:TetR/AcrR family transcriptional regulator [Propionicimonas sp.]
MDETSARSPGRYPKGVARRRQILEMAIAQFADRGVDAASLRSIGEAIGVSHTALRHYFSSRDELLIEVYRTHESLQHYTPTAGETQDAAAAISASAEANRAVPGLVQLYSTLSADALGEQHPITREFISARFDQLRSALAESVREHQAAGELRADVDADEVAALVIAASDGLQIQWMLAPDTVDVARCLDLVSKLLAPTSTQDAEGRDGGPS